MMFNLNIENVRKMAMKDLREVLLLKIAVIGH